MEPAQAFFGQVTARLRRFGELMQRRFGTEGHELVEELLDDLDAQIDIFFRDYDPMVLRANHASDERKQDQP